LLVKAEKVLGKPYPGSRVRAVDRLRANGQDRFPGSEFRSRTSGFRFEGWVFWLQRVTLKSGTCAVH
jgi:hypothetical protein